MDQENNPTAVAHKPPPLNSDQLNYLIWRYLQEAGYGDAAVKLQRDWKVDTDNLPFAPHIKGQALIKLVQQGLKYHHLSLTFDENGQQTRPLTPAMFYFGPDSAGINSTVLQKEQLLKIPDPNRGVSPASTIATFKPRARDPTSAGPEDVAIQAAKRGRKSTQSLADRNGGTSRKASGGPPDAETNGHTQHDQDTTSPILGEHTGITPAATGNQDDKMEVDHEGAIDNADVSMDDANDVVAPPIVPTLEYGNSIAIQVAPAKITNLQSATAILELGGTTRTNINKAIWQPSDNDMLFAQTETSCSYWNLRGQSLQPGSVKPLPTVLCGADSDSLITAASWDVDGTVLAVATLSGSGGQVNLYEGEDLNFVENLPASQRALTLLKWHSSVARLVGISPEADDGSGRTSPSSTLLCWDLTTSTGAAEPGIIQLPCIAVDVAVGGGHHQTEIFVSGENTISHCRGTSSDLRLEQTWQSPASGRSETWMFIRCAQRQYQDVFVVAACAETGSIWLPQQHIHAPRMHQGTITALEIRPVPSSANGTYPRTQFSTASDDGTIKIWEVSDEKQGISCLEILRFEPSSPIMSMAYSPDGFCLAGASYASARIWNAQHDYWLMAIWEGDGQWRGNTIRDEEIASKASDNGEGFAGAAHSLSWHSDNRRLAYGLGSQIALFNFQR